MKKKILFRADGNSSTGLGHLFRVFALIEIYRNHYNYILLTKENSALNVIPKEYNVQLIPTNIPTKDEPSWIATSFKSEEYIIIADGYHFKSGYQKLIKSLNYKLMYIDDLCKEKLYADVVVNHSLGLQASDFNTNGNTIFALGTKYAILRPLFIEASKKNRVISSIDTLFICFGGSDFYDITNTCLKGVLTISNLKQIHVVLGGAYKHDQIYETLKGNESKVFLYNNLSEKEILNLMNDCQLAIVPSSTISYEVCSVKMLVLGGYYVDNQENIHNGFVKHNLIYDGGDFNSRQPEFFKDKVISIIEDSNLNYDKKLDAQKKMFNGNQENHFLELLKKII